MRTKLLMLARGGLSLWSNRNLTLSRLSLSRSPQWVSIEVNNCVGQSNIQWRGWSYAASVPSDKPNSQKGQRRVSRNERRAMVESFVNTYRATNAGKFPTISNTVKHVGGSSYVVREIIQELKYKSKLNSSNSMDENLVDKKCSNKSKLLTTETVRALSGNTETAKDRPIQDDYQLAILDETDAGHEQLEEKRGAQTVSCERSLSEEAVVASAPSSHFIAAESNQLERDAEESKMNLWTSVDIKREEAEPHRSDSVAPECHLPIEDIEHASAPFSEISGSSQSKDRNSEFADRENHVVMEKTSIEKAECERREHNALKDLRGIDSPMEQGRGSVEMHQSKIDNPNREINDAEVPKKTSLWGNLKSFADDIMNIWRKF